MVGREVAQGVRQEPHLADGVEAPHLRHREQEIYRRVDARIYLGLKLCEGAELGRNSDAD